eukprot:TRINITY_DN1396_c0_g1_i1.p1 TRINITY_DN1396_c0_g1~~TRINITY_DN1396_c0_g1_i1.p1  ORF type:complete len:493 (+),score=121.99 TRINITY_DN1396_c0_g1_i1:72-1481(+)
MEVEKVSSVTLSARAEFKALSFSSEHELLVMPSLCGSELDEAVTRQVPVDIICVLDRSASMEGKKFEMLKHTIEMMVKHLRSCDRLCLIGYDSSVELMMPLTFMDSSGKDDATRAMKKLKVGGATNLSAGLFKALSVIRNRSSSNEVTSVLLLTDGHPTTGLLKTSDVVRILTSSLHQIEEEGMKSPSIFTFGYGSDHAVDLLSDISVGGGAYYYVETEESVGEAFGDCLGGLLSVIAQNIVLRIESVGLSTILDVSAVRYPMKVVKEGKIYEISMQDLYSGEHRDIPVRLSLPSTTAPVLQAEPICKFSVEFIDVVAGDMQFLDAFAKVARPETTPDEQPIDIRIDEERNRIVVTKALDEVSELGKEDRIDEARDVLRRASTYVNCSATAKSYLSQSLVRDVEDVLEQMPDPSHYVHQGHSRVKCLLHDYSHQRSAPRTWLSAEPEESVMMSPHHTSYKRKASGWFKR